MTNLRKLAERIASRLIAEGRVDVFSGGKVIEAITPLLREHNEELRRNLGSVLYQAQMLGYALPGEGFAEAYDNLVLSLGAIVDALGEGGEQDAMPQDRASNQGPADLARAAAPDQPHEFVAPLSSGASMASEGLEPVCAAVVRVTVDGDEGRCGLLRCDPIHQTNEVSDEQVGPVDRAAAVHAVDRAGDLVGDQPQVTNYDAEAEARAHEGVWVGPLDRVEWHDGRILQVVGPARESRWIVCDDIKSGGYDCYDPDFMRTFTGQPVLGFRERHEYEYGRRIADLERELADAHEAHDETLAIHQKREEYIDDLERELRAARGDALHNEDMRRKAERERDEARAERDELLYAMPKSVMRRIKAQGWVRLDNPTIADVAYEGPRYGLRQDRLAPFLRDLRDGKLKEGE